VQNGNKVILDSADLNPKHDPAKRGTKQSQMTKFKMFKTNQEFGKFEF